MCRNKMINYAQRSRNLSETNTETINELYYLQTRTLIFVYLLWINSYIIRHHTACYHDSGAIKETFYLKFAYSYRTNHVIQTRWVYRDLIWRARHAVAESFVCILDVPICKECLYLSLYDSIIYCYMRFYWVLAR